MNQSRSDRQLGRINSMIFHFSDSFRNVKCLLRVKRNPSKGGKKITHLRAQTRALRVANGFALCVFGLAVGSLVVAGAFPQKRQLDEKQRELEEVLAKEREVIWIKEDVQARHDALRHDPEYLELHARDRLNLHRPGETIYRIERNE